MRWHGKRRPLVAPCAPRHAGSGRVPAGGATSGTRHRRRRALQRHCVSQRRQRRPAPVGRRAVQLGARARGRQRTRMMMAPAGRAAEAPAGRSRPADARASRASTHPPTWRRMQCACAAPKTSASSAATAVTCGRCAACPAAGFSPWRPLCSARWPRTRRSRASATAAGARPPSRQCPPAPEYCSAVHQQPHVAAAQPAARGAVG
jgi:hypothetical protein